jgi:hypothetical protein
MAQAATKSAPLSKPTEVEVDGEKVIEGTNEYRYLSQQFDVDKKYMFQLAEELPEREHPVIDMVTKRPAPHKKFSPYRNIVFTSQIVWNGKRRMAR